MTIEKLLECDAEKLKAMTDEQLLEHFKPYLTVTRPELATKPEHGKAYKVQSSHIPPDKLAKMKKAEEMAAKLGIKLDLFNR